MNSSYTKQINENRCYLECFHHYITLKIIFQILYMNIWKLNFINPLNLRDFEYRSIVYIIYYIF
jgi:hypothetical protein